MKSKRHSPEQVIKKLSEGNNLLNEGATVAEVARSFGITETTWYRWKNQYGGMKANDAKRLKELETENKRLKNIVADQVLDIAMLKELAEETSNPEPQTRCCNKTAKRVRGINAKSMSCSWSTSLNSAAYSASNCR